MADGHLGKCKDCTCRDVKENYAAHREQYSAYDQTREQLPERRAAKRLIADRHRERHPERAVARNAVSNAVRDGRLVRGPCEVCGTTEKVQAHHADYAKPLEVRWLCFKCHREEGHGQVVTVADW